MQNLKEGRLAPHLFLESTLDLSTPDGVKLVCEMINDDKITPAAFLTYDFLIRQNSSFHIATEDILKFYAEFADKITNLNFLDVPQRSGFNNDRRFPKRSCFGLSQVIFPLLARLPSGWGYRFTEISKIVEALPNLKKIQLAGCEDPPSAYQKLKELPHLEELILESNKSISYGSLSLVTQLKVLKITGGRVAKGLSNLTNLNTLALHNCSIENTFSFSGMLHLTKLELKESVTTKGHCFSLKNLTALKQLEFDADLFAKDKESFCEVSGYNLTKLVTSHDLCFGAKRIIKWRPSNLKNLKKLCLKDNSSIKIYKITIDELGDINSLELVKSKIDSSCF